jgi:hypothetical protein
MQQSFHGLVKFIALDEYALCEVNEKRSDKGRMKFWSSECNEMIDGQASNSFSIVYSKQKSLKHLLANAGGQAMEACLFPDESPTAQHNKSAVFGLNESSKCGREERAHKLLEGY